MRGRRPERAGRGHLIRNTPAYAGKTRFCIFLFLVYWKHPRVCGEDRTGAAVPAAPLETPPRMRGRLFIVDLNLLMVGNTPAYAGKTASLRVIDPPSQKHPRVCGEDSHIFPPPRLPPETPPRMRGRLTPWAWKKHDRRNTPAYAGKTRRITRTGTRRSKHPRVCGEDKHRASKTA